MTATVVFDLDGTLVDSAPDLVAALNAILTREGLRPVEYAQARNMVGRGARGMIERGLAAEGVLRSAQQIEELTGDFIAYYAAHIADQSRVFPGVEAALDQLAASGYRLAVCSNKLELLSRRLLDRLGLSARFAAICGGDTFGVAKPDPSVLRGTIARAGSTGAAVVMVGDSITDIETARAAGLPVIAVDFGYSETPVRALGPDLVISDFIHIPGAVFDLIGAVAKPINTSGNTY
jgi:phosphoglycolate phosphatase